MPEKKSLDELQTENVRWDLRIFYPNPGDQQLVGVKINTPEEDLAEYEIMAKKFHDKYKGKLDTLLAMSLLDLCELEKLSTKIIYYLHFSHELNQSDEDKKTRLQTAEEKICMVNGEYLEFYELEVGELKEESIKAQCAESFILRDHLSYIRNIKKFHPHRLSEEVESALTKRAPYGPSSWAGYYHEVESELRFSFEGAEVGLEKIIHLMNNLPESDRRAAAMKVLNDGLRENFSKLSAQALNMTRGEYAVENAERHFSHPMASCNMENNLTDETIDALHRAYETTGAELGKKFYRLKAKLLGKKILRWSDRNALIAIPGLEQKVYSYPEALDLITTAYKNFDPLFGSLVKEISDRGWIDALAGGAKASGACCYTVILPGGATAVFCLLNHLGSMRDILVMAHELGHGVHGLLAGRRQGPLMFDPPIAYCETASVFGEMIVFEHLKETLLATGRAQEAFIALMGKIDDFLNTGLRQICFSSFERHVHNFQSRYSAWEYSAIMMTETARFYGKEGEIFTYNDSDYLGTHISHFLRPFYTHQYAIGLGISFGLYAASKILGDQFPALYAELLAAGGTKGAVELLAPFGLDPEKADFWQKGLETALGEKIDEAEKLAIQLGLIDP